MTATSRWAYRSALARAESRGMHRRRDVPGVDPQHVHVSIRQGALVIEGERRDTLYTLAGDFRRTERRYGRFHRTVPLPGGLDTGKATASMADGVLQVAFARSGSSARMPSGVNHCQAMPRCALPVSKLATTPCWK